MSEQPITINRKDLSSQDKTALQAGVLLTGDTNFNISEDDDTSTVPRENIKNFTKDFEAATKNKRQANDGGEQQSNYAQERSTPTGRRQADRQNLESVTIDGVQHYESELIRVAQEVDSLIENNQLNPDQINTAYAYFQERQQELHALKLISAENELNQRQYQEHVRHEIAKAHPEINSQEKLVAARDRVSNWLQNEGGFTKEEVNGIISSCDAKLANFIIKQEKAHRKMLKQNVPQPKAKMQQKAVSVEEVGRMGTRGRDAELNQIAKLLMG